MGLGEILSFPWELRLSIAAVIIDSVVSDTGRNLDDVYETLLRNAHEVEKEMGRM